jgi:hypothetical protein
MPISRGEMPMENSNVPGIASEKDKSPPANRQMT